MKKIMGSPHVTVELKSGSGGIPPIKIISDDEAETADAVVCVLATASSPFTDNVFTRCAECGVGIQHRPHAPKSPRKLCIRCTMKAARIERH